MRLRIKKNKHNKYYIDKYFKFGIWCFLDNVRKGNTSYIDNSFVTIGEAKKAATDHVYTMSNAEEAKKDYNSIKHLVYWEFDYNE
jgi:hypothetical protein